MYVSPSTYHNISLSQYKCMPRELDYISRFAFFSTVFPFFNRIKWWNVGDFFSMKDYITTAFTVLIFYKLNVKKCPEQNSARLLVDLLNSGRGSRIPGRPFKVSALASRLLGGRKLMVREGRTENTQSGEKAKAQEAFSFFPFIFPSSKHFFYHQSTTPLFTSGKKQSRRQKWIHNQKSLPDRESLVSVLWFLFVDEDSMQCFCEFSVAL